MSPYIDPGYIEPGYFEGDELLVSGRIVEIIGSKRLVEIVGMSRLVEIIGMSRLVEIIANDGEEVVYQWEEPLDPAEKKNYSYSWEDELAENGGQILKNTPPTGYEFFTIPTELVGKLNITGGSVEAGASPKIITATFEVDPSAIDDEAILGDWPITLTVETNDNQRYQRTCILTIGEL